MQEHSDAFSILTMKRCALEECYNCWKNHSFGEENKKLNACFDVLFIKVVLN